MKSIWITSHGGPDVLEVREERDPEPEPGEVRVRVKAAGLNFAEVMAREGLYPDAPSPPCVVGYEAAGVVDAHGEGVSEPPEGTRVLFMTRFGAHADTVCLPAEQAVEMPEDMSFEHGAALPVNYLTAYHMLFRIADLRPGQRVLIHMAAGGVGTAVLQLCRTVDDVTTFGTSSPGKHDYVREQGCTHPIDYRSLDYAEEVRRLTDDEGVDLVLDPLGGGDWRKGYDLLRSMGHLIAFGFANAAKGEKRSLLRVAWQYLQIPRFNPMHLMDDNRTVSGVNMGHLWHRQEVLLEELHDLLDLYEGGRIAPHVDRTFSFAEAADAHRRIHDPKNVGKIVLTPE